MRVFLFVLLWIVQPPKVEVLEKSQYQALVEKGRDFTISDGGISYQPPQLGDFLSTQYNNFLSSYRERLKFIKNNIRPGPQGFGTYTNLSSGAPAFARLRHLRARRVL